MTNLVLRGESSLPQENFLYPKGFSVVQSKLESIFLFRVNACPMMYVPYSLKIPDRVPTRGGIEVPDLQT